MANVRKWRKEHNLPGVGEPKKVFNRNFNSLASKLAIAPLQARPA